MKRSKFTDEQIIGLLREQEAEAPTLEVCRRHGISSATCLSLESEVRRHGGVCAKRLKALEEENARRKRLLADAMLDRPEEDRSVRGTDLPRAGL